MGFSLNPLNLLLFNLYCVILLQISLNWAESYCDSNSNVFQLLFVLLLFFRVGLQELHYNGLAGKKLTDGLTVFASVGCMVPLACYEIYALVVHKFAFDYYPPTPSPCFQSRIVFIFEIVLCFLTVLKDLFLIVCRKSETGVLG